MLDISRAFDSVSWPILKRALQRIKLPHTYIQLYENLSENKTICLRTAVGVSPPFTSDTGNIDQGDIASPLHWRIFIDVLLCYLDKLCVGVTLTASLDRFSTPDHLSTSYEVKKTVSAYVDDS